MIAGDVSGEQHGADVANVLKACYPDIIIEGVGGKAMAAAGVTLLENQEQMGRVGAGSITGAPYHWWLGQRLLKHVKHHRPDVVLHIDYGVFNIWLAQQFRRLGLPTVDYIPPQIWASRPGRIHQIKKAFDHVCCIFPFEEPLYQQHNVPVTYVGHPLASKLPEPVTKQAFCDEFGLDAQRPVLAVFPGSRKTEIGYLLNDMVAAVKLLNDHRVADGVPMVQPVMAVGDHFDGRWFDCRFSAACDKAGTQKAQWLILSASNRYQLLAAADVALAKSGTTTLEAALYQTPMAIVYKLHPLVAYVGFKIGLLPVIGLPNILTDPYQPPVPELLQKNCTPELMASTIAPLFDCDSAPYKEQMVAFNTIKNAMPAANASENVAEVLSRWLLI
jgi:lipid-A-disaccharide synthase